MEGVIKYLKKNQYKSGKKEGEVYYTTGIGKEYGWMIDDAETIAMIEAGDIKEGIKCGITLEKSGDYTKVTSLVPIIQVDEEVGEKPKIDKKSTYLTYEQRLELEALKVLSIKQSGAFNMAGKLLMDSYRGDVSYQAIENIGKFKELYDELLKILVK